MSDIRLQTYEESTFAAEGFSFPLFVKRPHDTAPAVVVMPEIPGIYSAVIDFTERLVADGFAVYMPSLTGTPGKPYSWLYVQQTVLGACIRREFSLLARNRSSPVTAALRALCRHAHRECGGPGVGAIGMCITGNFALSLMVDPSVVAPVLSQPSLPADLGPSYRRALHVGDDELVALKKRVDDGVEVLGLRFTHDKNVPDERFSRLRDELGDGFCGVDIDSGPGNAHGLGKDAHSVVTRHLVDEDGHPTQHALHQVLSFFRSKLMP